VSRPIVPPGTPIAVVAPSHAYDPAKLAAGMALAREAGHDLHLFEGTLTPDRYLASGDATRLAHLTDALRDPAWGAVWAVRGGSGVSRLLRHLPWHDLPARPLLGFSDLTPLLHHLAHATGAVTVHAPVLHSLSSTDPSDREALFRLLAGQPVTPVHGVPWVDGDVDAPAVGGNLAMLASTCGTPWQVRAEGKLLLLEDVGEAPYRVDRMIQQLLDAGVFRGVAGVLLGTWDGCRPPEGAPWTLDDVLRDLVTPLGVPVLAHLPVGHGARNHPVPFGPTVAIRGGALHVTPELTLARSIS
jgi:muramoyltetrapeptide carboxypeptidase